MTNIEKEVKNLKVQVEKLKEDEKAYIKKIEELESENESLQEPLSLDKVINSLPIHDAVNVLTRLSHNTYGRAQERIQALRNETGLLENNIETMEMNAKHLSQGKIYKR